MLDRNLLMAIVYLLVCAVAVLCVRATHTQGTPRGGRLHWVGVAAAFLGLAAARVTSFEDVFREDARAILRESGRYASRQDIQIPLAVLLSLAGAALAVLAWKSLPRTMLGASGLVWISRWATLGFVPLMCARLVSLHAIDRVLYAGPIRLNWIIDIGLTLACASAATLYLVRHGDLSGTRRGERARGRN